MSSLLPALVVLFNVLLLWSLTVIVILARRKFALKAPATCGHPDFERAYRVQMNTLEATVLFLPTLWLASAYGFGFWAGLTGLVWIIARVWYAFGYLKNAARRRGGFMLALLAWLVVLFLALIGVMRALMRV